MSAFYKFDVIADAKKEGWESIGDNPSINDKGIVAFMATPDISTDIFAGPFNGEAIRDITGSNSVAANSTRAVQINNDNKIVTQDSRIDANFKAIGAVRVRDANKPGATKDENFENIVTTSGSIFDSFDTVFSQPSINNKGQVVFSALKDVNRLLATEASIGYNRTPLSTQSAVAARPMIADNGQIVVRFGNKLGDGTTPPSPIKLFDYDLSKSVDIANASPNPPYRQFTKLGMSPGISDDGNIVVFAGDRGKGPGIFASINNIKDEFGFRTLIPIAGENTTEPKAELGYDDSGAPIFLDSFDLDSRVAVSYLDKGENGITAGDSFVVSLIGKPNKPSRNNPVTNKPFFFSGQEGLWTVRVAVEKPLSPTAPPEVLDFNKTSPIPAIQIGDKINGATVDKIAVYDPLGKATTDVSKQQPGDHRLAFWASTDKGNMVVRAEHLDTDGDGLLDDWETNGIDIDQDGVVDLNLAAMGANPLRKDLFLEIDWLKPDLVTNGSKTINRDFSPQPEAIDFLVDMFAKAPFKNPDGSTGISVHVDAGKTLYRNMSPLAGGAPNPLYLQGGDEIAEAVTGNHIHGVFFGPDEPVTFKDPDPLGRPIVVRSFENIKNNFFGTTTKRARELAFHYAIFADEVAKKDSDDLYQFPGNSGWAEISVPDSKERYSIPGNDLIISLQGSRGPENNKLSYVPNPSSPESKKEIPYVKGFYQGQTLAHELGHNLGLFHGGFDNLKTNPPGTDGYNKAIYDLKVNYQSLMNYIYQGFPGEKGELVRDYSRSLPFDDWSHIKLDFSNYLDNLGNSFGKEYQLGTKLPNSEESEITRETIEKLHGPSDNETPLVSINQPAPSVEIVVGNSLTVDLTATDNSAIQSVRVSFDINGNGVVDARDETVVAAPTGTNKYQATFANISGTVGTRTITAKAFDLFDFTSTASVDVKIAPISSNNPPVANNDKTLTFLEDAAATPLDITAPTDANSDALTITIDAVPETTKGVVRLADNTAVAVGNTLTVDKLTGLVFAPVANANGAAGTFSYTVSDGKGGKDSQIVTVAITSVNDAPLAQDDTATTNQNTPVTIASTTLLANDSDIDGDVLNISKVGNANNGSVVLDQDGKVVFTPTTNFTGEATFDYTVSDSNGGSGTAKTIVTVKAVSDPNPTPEPTPNPTPTPTPNPTPTPTPNPTPTPTPNPTPTPTPTPIPEPTPNPIPTPTPNPIPTPTPNPIPTRTPNPTPTRTPNPTPTPTPTAIPEPTPTPIPEPTPTPIPEPTPTPIPEPTPTPIPEPTPNPEPTQTLETIGGDTLIGTDNDDSITGTQNDDVLIGKLGNDSLFGGLGNDLLYGNKGKDVLNGNQGNDSLYGGKGNDVVGGGKDNDLVLGDSGDDALFGGMGNDTVYGGKDNDVVHGGKDDDLVSGDLGNDTLFGDLGNDTLYGGAGDDLLNGGLGNDSLIGGEGRDRFAIASGAGVDTITDFQIGQDLLGLSGGVRFDQLTISQGTGMQAQDTLIRIASTGELLASVTGLSSSSLTQDMFALI
ncbi:MAG: tandem-95 repeat protein [Oscillatoriales cyanobacterium]|nr:MAG: tandem-95 repeat protein [Oscillatoriales cyanobacterium]